PMRRRFAPRACGFARRRQALDRTGPEERQAAPLFGRPSVEFNGILEMNAVEERAGVQRGCGARVASGQGALEISNVAADDAGIQAERGGSQDQLRVIDLSPKRVDRLLEGVARALLVAFRPEVEEELVPADSGRARDGKQGEQGQPAALGGWSGERNSVDGKCEAAERGEAKHGCYENGAGKGTR